MKTQKNTILIASQSSPYDATDRKVEFVLKTFDKTYRGTDLHTRFGICFVAKGGEARQVCEGPMVPGPWAQTFTLCTAICSDTSQNTGAVSDRNIEAGTEAVVEAGDLIQIDDHPFIVRIRRDFGNLRMDLELVKVSDADL